MFFAEAFGAWLLERVADAGRKQLTGWIFSDEQQRKLRQAASAAIEGTADELCPRNLERAAHLAMVMDHVFREPLSRVPPDEHVTILEVRGRASPTSLRYWVTPAQPAWEPPRQSNSGYRWRG